MNLLAPPHPTKPGLYLNIPGLWKPCPGLNGQGCENYVLCPYWVCLLHWQLFCTSHGNKIQQKDKVSEKIP